jgi:sugar fermentation stimulation protein A
MAAEELVLVRFPPLVEGRFIKRLNRFAALVDINRREHMAHVPNSGRMEELLVPGYRVLLAPAPRPSARKTAYDLAIVDLGTTLSSADARLPNHLVAEAIAQGRLPQFADYPIVRPESVYGESRLDFRLEGPPGVCYVETKSVTLVVDGVGLFPDAPTLRGVKHLHSLMAARAEGHRADVIFVIQRDDAEAFAPHDSADPLLGRTLREAVDAGVAAWAYRCRLDETSITLADSIPVLL